MTRPDEKRLAKGLWWDRNWGVVEGCSKVSQGCQNCFAEVYAHRFGKSLSYLKDLTDDNGHWTGKVNFRFDQINLPLLTKKPKVWFVGERSDLFHESVPFEYIAKVFATMGMCCTAKDARKNHLFIVLTKRPERMREFLDFWTIFQNLPNVLTGVTAENQEQADARIPVLLSVPVAKRFVSIEPMLGPIDLFRGHDYLTEPAKDKDGKPCRKKVIDWVICGGESGSGARPVHPHWVRSVRDECRAAGVPFLFKQWGEWAEDKQHGLATACARGCRFPDGTMVERVGKKTAGRMLDGKEHLGWPE